MLVLEADHRAHAEVENTIRDLKYGMGLNHLPSGRFGANGAWFALNVMAHNLVRWAGAIALVEGSPMTTKTVRRRLVALPGRLARSGRRLSLHLPERWPGRSSSCRRWRCCEVSASSPEANRSSPQPITRGIVPGSARQAQSGPAACGLAPPASWISHHSQGLRSSFGQENRPLKLQIGQVTGSSGGGSRLSLRH